MNLKRILSSLLVLTAFLLGACGDDDKPSIKEQFSFEDESFTLKDANAFLTYDGTFDGRLEKDYLFTDGTYDLEDDEFTNATYFIEVYLTTTEEEDEFKKGKYPQWYFWEDAPATSRIGYVEAYSALDDLTYFSFETQEDEEDGDPVEISGGFDDGETITVKFSGDLEYYHYDATEEEWIAETVSGKFTVKGEIEDISSSGPAKHHARSKH
jgi:hypothetical protein